MKVDKSKGRAPNKPILLLSIIDLFEKGISDLQVQKNRRELEIMIQECILTSIRESIPTESIIRAYMDESMEEEEEVTIEAVPDEEDDEEKKDGEKKDETKEEGEKEPEELPKEELPPVLSVENVDDEKVVTRLTFNDMDETSDGTTINAPKTIERLEEISEERNAQRKAEEMEDDDDDEDLGKVKIHMDDDVELDGVFDLDKPASNDLIVLDDVEDL